MLSTLIIILGIIIATIGWTLSLNYIPLGAMYFVIAVLVTLGITLINEGLHLMRGK